MGHCYNNHAPLLYLKGLGDVFFMPVVELLLPEGLYINYMTHFRDGKAN